MNSASDLQSRSTSLWAHDLVGLTLGALTASVYFSDSWSGIAIIVLITILCVTLSLIVRLSGLAIRTMEPTLTETPLLLAREPELFDIYEELSQSLLRIGWRKDPIFREVALKRLAKVVEEAIQVSRGEVVFEGTETWRIVYEDLLRSRGLYQYRSVSWVTTEEYWQDAPGQQSIQLNAELHENGQLGVERIVVVADKFWPAGDILPSVRIQQWIHLQHIHGIWVQLVRESQLSGESDLVADFGIYGARAVGYQTVDEHGRTIRFSLRFTIDEIERAEERWQRLQVYSTSYADLLDRKPRDD